MQPGDCFVVVPCKNIIETKAEIERTNRPQGRHTTALPFVFLDAILTRVTGVTCHRHMLMAARCCI